MRNEQVECVQHQNRNAVVPYNCSSRDTIRYSSNKRASDRSHPNAAQYAHVTVLVVLMCLVVTAGNPCESAAEEAVFDSGEVGVGLDDHDVLDCETVASWVELSALSFCRWTHVRIV